MNRLNKKHKDAWKTGRFTLAALAAVILLVCAAIAVSIGLIGQIQKRVRNATVEKLSELTDSKVKILEGILKETETDLHTLAMYLDQIRRNNSSDGMLEYFKEAHSVEALAVLDDQGRYVYGTEEELALNGIPKAFALEVAANNEAMSDSVFGKKGKRQILFGVMIPSGGRIYTAISAETLENAYGENTHSGHEYSYVADSEGNIVLPPKHYSYEQVYGNIRQILAEGDNNPAKLNAFMQALSEGKAGSIALSFDQEEVLLCFEPLDVGKDWRLITVVPLAVVEKDGIQIIQMSIYMACIIAAALAMILVLGAVFYFYSQRKQRENDRFLRNIYQAISENIDTVIFILDDKSACLDYVFENSGRILGIPAREFMESGESQGEDSLFKGKLLELLWQERSGAWFEEEIQAYNDRLQKDMWLKALVRPFYLVGNLKYIYAITDVTEERKARENITAAVVAAEQANAAKSQFLANMSHDIRTPMNGIVGMTAVAKMNLDSRERLMDCLDKISLSSKLLLELINDVLDMSKIESGKLTLSQSPFDLAEVFNALESMMRPQCIDRRQTLIFRIEDTVHRKLVGDTVRLNQIFANLLSNAVKFTPEGGRITMTAHELEQRHAEFAVYRFIVADTGIGMSPEFKEVIFTPFERANDMTVKRIEGTGLGMAITKNLISAMGGQISVESEKGKGSRFIVDLELPLQEPGQVEEVKEEAEVDADLYTGKRFLLAEDNELNQEIVVALFSQYGAEVEVVENGEEALKRFQGHETGYYDAIFMDIQMPVMDGYQAAKAIRVSGHPQARDIPIIAMTANAFAEDMKAAREAGMDGHISKPIDMAAVSQALGAAKGGQQF